MSEHTPHSTPEVFYMTLGELDLELELVRKSDHDSLLEQLETAQTALRRFFDEYDGDSGEYAPFDATEALMRAALNPASMPPSSDPRPDPQTHPEYWME